jgi:predicted ATPase/DNA-binding winged helix-turn-helix (wHTH) protein
MEPIPLAPTAIEFGRFRILPHRRELLAESQPLELGGRAFDVLMVLIEASGAVVSKDALMHGVWPDRIVEENNLQAQISALRRAFGADRDLIRTIAGRGYQFTGDIRTVSTSPDPRPAGTPTVPVSTPARIPTNLPEAVSELIGRDVELDEILALTTSHRLVTLTGTGGIGKTRLSLEVARRVLPRFADGVWAIELAPLSDPELVPVAIATALGLELASGTASPLSVANALRSQQLMLVLDNCEHVVDAAARMAAALLRVNLAARVIATSREPLRTEGERVYPVPPLAVPAEGTPDGEDPLRYGAVRLFVKRARAAAPSFSPDARMAAAMAGICRRLDGIPLAIELAAARAAALGVEGVAARLDDRFHLLTGGRRTALPRHQTLTATLDWSYDLLDEREKAVLRCLSVFAGSFSLQAAVAVAGNVPGSPVVDCIANLIAKSMAVADLRAEAPTYRLLDTTRLYALEKLRSAGEQRGASERHARYYRNLSAEAQDETEVADDGEGHLHHHLDNVRAALDWAISPEGDAQTAVELTLGIVPLLLKRSLMHECEERVERAIGVQRQAPVQSPRTEMQLAAALATSLFHTKGAVQEVDIAWKRTLELAVRLNETDYQLRALWGLWSYRISAGDYPGADTLARRFHKIATRSNHAGDLLIAERMMGGALHFLGDQAAARRHIESMLSQYNEAIHHPHIVRFHYDQRLAARVTLARILWAQGFPEQAMHAAAEALDEAQASQHTISLCFALNEAAIPVALFVGDWAAAERYIEILVSQSAEHALIVLHARALGSTGVLASKRGDPGNGVQIIRDALRELDKSGYHAYPLLLGSLAEALGAVGEIEQGLASIEAALSRCERNGERWYIADLLRIKGELILRSNDPQAFVKAKTEFSSSLEWARRQGALSWELRAATSLAQLLRDQGRSADATVLLRPVYDRFTEGLATADLKAAKTLLDDLSVTRSSPPEA